VLTLRARRLGALGALASAIGFGGCAAPRRTPTGPQLQQWVTDSVANETRLSRWLRDSTVMDSLSRFVSTDSLYRLYRAMYVAQNPRIYVEPIMCLEFELVFHHGRAPAEVAMQRMKDSLWKPGEGGLPSIERRMPSTAFFSMSDSICGGPVGRPAPDTVAGTWLGYRFPRPVRPSRPR